MKRIMQQLEEEFEAFLEYMNRHQFDRSPGAGQRLYDHVRKARGLINIRMECINNNYRVEAKKENAK